MPRPTDDVTRINEEATRRFNGPDRHQPHTPRKDEDVETINEEANAEFYGDDAEPEIGTGVGGISGNPD